MLIKLPRESRYPSTYDIVLDSVDGGVGLLIILQSMFNLIDLDNTQLLERPPRKSLCKLLVGRMNLLSTTQRLDQGSRPHILEHLRRTNKSESRRVASLESRNQGELLARGKEIIRVDGIGLLLGVVAIRGVGGAEDGSQEGAGAENVADGVGDGQHGAGLLKVVLQTGADVGGVVEDEDVVRDGGGVVVVVEVVDDGSRSLGGEGDVEFGEEGDDGGWDSAGGGGGEEDVTLGIDKVEKDLGSQVRSQA